ncbi:MAG: hypothetical protein LBN10_01410 [Propionibacteriaceae bacterium]|nr:hypothetical protein [Propionibacteriaceae bacterium]
MNTLTQVRTEEFDAFGPWVLPVRTPDEVPPLFRAAADLTAVRLALKIPRPIERRNANPAMDLYDRLILVRDSGVEVISRAPQGPSGWKTRWLEAGDLLAVETSTALLDGQFRLHVTGGDCLDLPYNGVSADVMDSLSDAIRAFWRPSGEPLGNTSEHLALLRDDDLDQEDVGLINHLRKLCSRDPALRPLLLRRRSRATRSSDDNFLIRAWYKFRPRDLQAAILATTESELVVVHRRGWLTPKYLPVYSLATTVVPPAKGIQVEARDDPHWLGVRELRLAPTAITLLATPNDGVEKTINSLL